MLALFVSIVSWWAKHNWTLHVHKDVICFNLYTKPRNVFRLCTLLHSPCFRNLVSNIACVCLCRVCKLGCSIFLLTVVVGDKLVTKLFSVWLCDIFLLIFGLVTSLFWSYFLCLCVTFLLNVFMVTSLYQRYHTHPTPCLYVCVVFFPIVGMLKVCVWNCSMCVN